MCSTRSDFLESVDFIQPERESLPDQIVRSLRQAILTASISPGMQLKEHQLADKFGVSRAVLREALKVLEAEGLVVARPHRGRFIRGSLSREELVSLFDLRCVLESYALTKAVERSPNLCKDLRAVIEGMESLKIEGHAKETIELDAQFHKVIYQAAADERLIRILSSLSSETRISLAIHEEFHADSLGFIEDHRLIADAVCAGKIDEAIELLVKHIEFSRELVWNHIQKRDDQ